MIIQNSKMLYYIVVTLISFGIVLFSYFSPHALSIFGREFNQGFANAGLILLWVTLLVKPVFMIMTRYLARKRSGIVKLLFDIFYKISRLGMQWRRKLGITTFLLIFVHAGMWIVSRLKISYSLMDQWKNLWMLSGYLGLIMLFIGYITSNNYSMKLFKKNWKLIQYSAYFALLFAILHLLLLNFGAYFGQLILLVFYIILKLVEKKKN